jgi:hypothetical protein
MNLADMMEGLRCAANNKTKFCGITLTQAEITPILSGYDSLRAENERLRAEMFDTATRQALQKRGDVPWTGEREGCPHDFIERETAVTADGYCPLCMATELTQLRERLATCRELREYDRKEIHRLRAVVSK